MGNCSGYCNGQGENESGQIRNSFKEGALDINGFEKEYDGTKGRALGKGMNDGFQEDGQADEYGRV